MSFLYSIALKCLYPTSLCLVLLLGAVVFRRRQRLGLGLLWTAIAILLVCGNGWLIDGLTRGLEHQYLPADPIPSADCILVLAGGVNGRIPPRTTVEVGEAGDRILYAAHLYRNGKGPVIVVTGGVATGGLAPRPGAVEIAELLEALGVPRERILTETGSGNTREHARELGPLFAEQRYQRILLVTSALHMPRSMGVFRHRYPGIEFIPSPTDFRSIERLPRPWYRHLTALIPTPKHLLDFSEVTHEYLGMAYYRVRGWM